MNYYKEGSAPLLPLKENEVEAHQIVYTETGRCVKKIYIEDNVFFVDVVESVLNEGETLSGLTPLQLELFWTLSRSKLKNHNENTNRSQRRRILS